MATGNSFAPSPLLTQLANNFKNRDYIAEQIFSAVQVPQFSGQYTTFDTDVLFRPTTDAMTQYGQSNMIDIAGTLASFTVDTHALHVMCDEKELAMAGPVALRQYKVNALMNSMKLNLEILAAASLASTSVYTSGETLSGTDQWSDYTNSNPRVKIQDIKRAALVDFNTAVMSRRTANILLNSTKLLNLIVYTQRGFTTDQILAEWLGVDRVIIGSAKKLTNKKGQTQVLTEIWGNDVYLLNLPAGGPSPTLANPAPGYLAVHGTPWQILTSRDALRGTGAGVEVIKCESNYKLLVSAPTMAYRLTAAVA